MIDRVFVNRFVSNQNQIIMKNFTMLTYSILSYIIGFASIVYWIGSVSNLIPEISIDQDPKVPFLLALLNNIVLVALFGVQHSIMARKWFKDFFASYFPKAIERSTFILVSGLLLFFLVIQWQPMGGVIWDVSSNMTANYIAYTLFFAGWSILFISTFLINHADFFGLRQVYFEITNKPYKELNFKAIGFYKYMRHPIYFGGMLGLWATPVMTVTHLVFAIGLSAYFIIGTLFEEKDLMKEFGNIYTQYAATTPKYIPFTKSKNSNRSYLKRMNYFNRNAVLFILFAVLSVGTTAAQTIAIPDTNFEQALIDLGYDTNGLNGNILQSEAEAVTFLNIQNENISSLSGIEGFTNLSELVCSNNSLGSLDLSNNLNLTQLYAENNQLTSVILDNNTVLYELNVAQNQLTALHIENNTALASFWANDNFLTSLNVSNNTLLWEVSLNNNELTSFNIGNNIEIERLYLHNNLLTSLNVANGNNTSIVYLNFTNNPNLYCIEVDDPAYSTALWSNFIDPQSYFSENCTTIAIPDTNFEQTLIDLGYDTNGLNGNILQSEAEAVTNLGLGNRFISDATGIESFINLTYLNFSNNDISDLQGIESLINLEILICNNNNLTSLDVSNNTALKGLHAGGNALENLDVSNNILLESLTCSTCELTNIDVNNNPDLTYLEVYENQLTNIDITNNPDLEYLSVASNQLSSIDLSNHAGLIEVYAHNNQLISLNIKNGTNTIITDFEADGNPDLYCIEVDDAAYSTALWSNYIDPQSYFSEDCTPAAIILIPDANFEQALIDFGYDTNGLNGNILQSEAEAVIMLNVANQGIASLEGIAGFVNLTELYCNYNVLTSLDVSENILLETLYCYSNQLSSIVLGDNTVLEKLVVNNNQLTTIDIENITALKELETRNNLLTSLDVTNNTLLEDLSCSQNNITSLDISNLVHLTYLSITSNQIANLDVSTNTALTYIDAYENQLTSIDLSNNVNLEYFSSYTNQFTTLDLSDNPALNYLDVSDNQLTGLDLSTNPLLVEVYVYDNELANLNVKNGNNTIITDFNAYGNSNLYCIEVDDAPYSTALWGDDIDPQSYFSEDCTILDVEEIPSIGVVKLYPNPANGVFYIDGLQETSAIVIYDVNSRIVFKGSINSNQPIDISTVPAGIYFINISNTSESTTKKLVIR